MSICRNLHWVLFLSVWTAPNLMALELLSEGAMEAVSAVSANSAEELVGLSGAPGAGITIDQDGEIISYTEGGPSLAPFTEGVSSAEELNEALSEEVNEWAEELGDEAVTVSDRSDFLRESVSVDGFDENLPDERLSEDPEEEDEGSYKRTTVLAERIDRPIREDAEGVNSVTYENPRIVERAITDYSGRNTFDVPIDGTTAITNSFSRNSQIFHNRR